MVVTPERIRRWADQHSQMSRLGIKTPVPWGHQRAAVPSYPGESQYLASKLNAGYFPELKPSADGKRLEAIIDAPGLELDHGNLVTMAELPDGRKVKTAIGEVSAAIAKNFRDGKGRMWNDVLTHIAVTPLPVWAGQSGFQALGLEPETVCLSLGAAGWTLATGDKAMPLPPKDDEGDEGDDIDVGGDEGGDAGAGAADGGASPMPDAPPEGTPPGAPPAPGGAPNPDQQQFYQAKAMLMEHGIALPDSTTPENGWEHLAVALTALKGKLEPKDSQDDPNAPLQPDDKNAPVIAENSPSMLSLQRDNPAAHSALTKMREKEKARVEKRLAKKLERARSVLPAEKMLALEQSGTFNLSLTTEGDLVAPKEFDREEVIDFVLAARPAKVLTETLSAATVHANPLQAKTELAKEQEKVTNEMAAMVGAPTPKP